ncbi:inositol monophosphatase family protein [Streptomyces sp. SL13]|uniref:Inositol monophosphatase family protein n=1 Tax=Streptantibioticus silvisoli TaxID=2705255 RepID=A0AA90H632_9ACTN|nr:inositol monophosphatase family protein [Streptantibioticus silvisoli]MDI5965628.1 inositol monophosphatase family protein [Streptantibioticus silvisoli]MDI5971575.1 inositol monophosphatase family protein [Streptantibioticus silvisoli]
MSSVTMLWTALEDQLLPVFSDYRARLADLPVEVKDDRTLLTEADVVVQDLIIAAIRKLEPGAVVIAEEDERTKTRTDVRASEGRVWVVDPIDGTAEFVRAERTEFCSVVCLLEDWQPSAAFVLAPELATGRQPIIVTADASRREIRVGGELRAPFRGLSGHVSATRSADEDRTEFDTTAKKAGLTVKSGTTSQTIDMVRTTLDLSDLTTPALPPFDLFWRRHQKLWDGAAGLCLAKAAGLRSCTEQGKEIPLDPEFLSAATPVFSSDITGRPESVDWLLKAMRG